MRTKNKKVARQVKDKSRLVGQQVSQSRSSGTKHGEVRAALEASQEREYSLFENVPISLWEEDFSAVKAYIDGLRSQCVRDFREYFDNNPEAVDRCVKMVRIADVNQATLVLFEADNKDELLRGLSQVFGKETYDVFKEELIALAEGKTSFESEAITRTLKGRDNFVYLTLSIAPGYEDTWSIVLLSLADITKRKQIERQLKNSQEYLEKLNNSLEHAIFTVSLPERIITYINHSVLKVFGYKPEECIGKTTAFFFPTITDFNIFGEKLNKTIEAGSTVLHIEDMRKKKNGDVFPAESTTTFFTENGKITHFVCILRDITMRKQAQETIKAERQRFYDVLEMLPAYLVLLTQDYHVPFANRFFRERFGESQGRRCFEYLFGRTEPCEICETYTVLKTMVPHEWEWIGPDGRNYYVFDFPFVDTDGSTIILEMGIDVTVRKQTEEILRQGKARLTEAERIAHLGNWNWNIATNELVWSDEIYRIFGLSPQQFGATYDAFINCVHPEDRELVKESVNNALHKGNPYSIDHRIILPDKSVRVVHEMGEVTFDETGTPIRMIGTVHDITERKRAEDELRYLSHELVNLQENERRTIGHELHDEIGQSLTALQLLLNRASLTATGDIKNELSQAKSQVVELMRRIREMSIDLYPSMLDSLGLLPALTWQFDRFTKLTHVDVIFEHTEINRSFAPKIALATYRIIQEALTNVARYAGVDGVKVNISTDGNAIHIKVEDRGKGFNINSVYARVSSGISGMRERALALGGTLSIDTSPGSGTRIMAELPLFNKSKRDQTNYG